MKLENFKILRVVVPLFIPYIILYAMYIQFNGEVSPGGGFQAGVILASGLIAYDLIFGYEALKPHLPISTLTIGGVLGVGIYATVGLVAFFFDKNYLNYNVLLVDALKGQHLGIFLVEIGVGITVSSIMFLIYAVLRK